ncbi:MAG: FG-GAP-like repeat-containing protein [Patescibacteria group bacterium]|nr:FG-GAP-like repeat-containing protein [Patescibacteria group bacterium]
MTRDSKTENYAPAITYTDAKVIELPKATSYAEKRGFGDFNGDGITDMLEISDDAYIGQDYKVNVFYGYINKQQKLQFSEKHKRVKLPIKMKWFSSATKLDVGDINGDGYADVIFTQYSTGIVNDSLNMAFAINNKGNGSFTPQFQMVKNSKGLNTIEIILALIDAYEGARDGDSLYDYLKMDWADLNGDGTDDLLLMWDDYNDLYVDTVLSYPTEDGKNITLESGGSATIPNFLKSRSVKWLDTGNYNNDKMADITVRDSKFGGSKLIVSVAINKNGHFEPHKDSSFRDTDMDTFGFEKIDTFDVNQDGIDDYVHIGNDDNKKVMSYNILNQ